MLIILSLNTLVAYTAFLITDRWLKIKNTVDFFISLFLVYLSQIILSQLILGITSKLTLNNLIIFNFIISLLVFFAVKDKPKYLKPSQIKQSLNLIFKSKVALLLLSALISFSLVKIIFNLINAPLGWDSLNYHFPFAIEWLKNANLYVPITICDDPGPSYYPINGSLFYLWLIFPLKNVFIADLGQVPFFILTFLAVYNISRKFELDQHLSFFAASLACLIPNFFKQQQLAYVDIMVAGLFLACVNFLLTLNKKFSLKYTLLFSLSFGLLLGTKTIAFPYCGLLTLPIVYLFIRSKKIPAILIWLIVTTLLGGFSYIRNFLQTHNPLYPLDFSLLGIKIFKGVIDKATYSAHFNLKDYSILNLLFHEGLGGQTILLVTIGTILTIPVLLIKKIKTNFFIIYICLLPILLYLVYRYIIPLANARYLYPLLGLGIILGFFTLKNLKTPGGVIRTLTILCCLYSIFELAKNLELFCCMMTFSSLVLFSMFYKNFWQKILRKPIIISLSLIFFILLISLNKTYNRQEYLSYINMTRYSGFWPEAAKAWAWLNNNTTGNNIAYTGRPVPLPLYGTNFKNTVYYVSVNKTDPAKLHYFPNSQYHWGYDFLSLHKNIEEANNYRGQANYQDWLNNLAKRNTDFIFIYSLHQTENTLFPIEDSWAKGNKKNFNLVFENDTIHIYKIIK